MRTAQKVVTKLFNNRKETRVRILSQKWRTITKSEGEIAIPNDGCRKIRKNVKL